MAGRWNWGEPGWGRARSLLCGAVWPRQAPAVIQSRKGAPPGRWPEAQPQDRELSPALASAQRRLLSVLYLWGLSP